MYKTVEEKPIEKEVEKKQPNKGLFWPVLVLIPTILLILILGAAVGTIIGFNNKVKGFESRINLLEESIMLKVNLNEKNLVSLQEQIAQKSPRKSDKTEKKKYYNKSSKTVKVLKTVMGQQYTARSHNAGNKFSPPL